MSHPFRVPQCRAPTPSSECEMVSGTNNDAHHGASYPATVSYSRDELASATAQASSTNGTNWRSARS